MRFLLTPAQARNLHDAIKAKRKCTLTLSTSRQSPSGVDIPLTEKQIRLLSDGRSHKITIGDKAGGILPFLAPLLAALPAIAAGTTAVAATTATAKKIYDWSKGKGVGGFLPFPALVALAPAIKSIIHKSMQQSGKGIKETVADIFLNPIFLSHLAKTIGKPQGSGLRLGPPPYGSGLRLGTSRGRGMMLGPPRHLY